LIFGALVVLGIAAFAYYKEVQNKTSEIEVTINLKVDEKGKKDESQPTKKRIKEKKDSKKQKGFLQQMNSNNMMEMIPINQFM